MITEAVALPLSKAQIYAAAVDAWEFSFGQEPGAKLTDRDTSNNRIVGVARVNYRSAQLGSRLGSMGVINYNITIQTENGQCQVRISHLSHTGNRNAPSGAIDLGDDHTETDPGGSRGGSGQRVCAHDVDSEARTPPFCSILVSVAFSIVTCFKLGAAFRPRTGPDRPGPTAAPYRRRSPPGGP